MTQARGIPAICIGPTTAEAARASGLNVVGVAEQYTVAGLVAAVTEWAKGGRKETVNV
jgi:uroporphyrinogen-III synthase